LLKEQIGGSRSTWPWFEHMTNIIKSFVRGKGALKGVDQGITKVIKDEEHKMPKIQALTPTPSNEDGVRDVFLEMFITTLKRYTYFFSYAIFFYCKLPEVFSEVISCNYLLMDNVNYLEEVMNKFVEGSNNVK